MTAIQSKLLALRPSPVHRRNGSPVLFRPFNLLQAPSTSFNPHNTRPPAPFSPHPVNRVNPVHSFALVCARLHQKNLCPSAPSADSASHLESRLNLKTPTPVFHPANAENSRNSAQFSHPLFFLNSTCAAGSRLKLMAFGFVLRPQEDLRKCASAHTPANPPYVCFLCHSAFRLPHSALAEFRSFPLNSG